MMITVYDNSTIIDGTSFSLTVVAELEPIILNFDTEPCTTCTFVKFEAIFLWKAI